MVFIEKRLRGRFFAKVTHRLHGKKLDYKAKTTAIRENREELPVFFYIPSFLALNLVIETAKLILETMEDMNIDKTLMFKPDLFTHHEIYSNTVVGIKPYIYTTKPR